MLTLILMGQNKALSRRGTFVAFVDFKKVYMTDGGQCIANCGGV